MTDEISVWWVGWHPNSGSEVLLEVEGIFYISEVGDGCAFAIQFIDCDGRNRYLSRSTIKTFKRLKGKSKEIQDSEFWSGIVGGGSLEHLLCDDLRAVIEKLIDVLGDELEEARNAQAENHN